MDPYSNYAVQKASQGTYDGHYKHVMTYLRACYMH